jgi:hypothetical protein
MENKFRKITSILFVIHDNYLVGVLERGGVFSIEKIKFENFPCILSFGGGAWYFSKSRFF